MTYTLLTLADLQRDGDSYEFEGYLHGNASVTFILVEVPPNGGPRLHTHPYEEVFVVQEGQATYTIGTETVEIVAGQIAIVPAGVPHKFVNTGTGRLKQVDIHAHPHFITEWLEDQGS
jgi:mannose-6-phosphate isomerase-like protein (cupin superfamily)